MLLVCGTRARRCRAELLPDMAYEDNFCLKWIVIKGVIG